MGPTFPKDKDWLGLGSFPIHPRSHGSLKALYVFNFHAWLCKPWELTAPSCGTQVCLRIPW